MVSSSEAAAPASRDSALPTAAAVDARSIPWLERLLLGGNLLAAALLAALGWSLERSAWPAILVLGGELVVLLVGKLAPMPRIEPERSVARTLLPLASVLRLSFLVLSFSLLQANGLETVGSDAGMFLKWGRTVAQYLPAIHDITPYYYAGTYDIGFHYMLGFALRAFGGSLLAIHVLLAFVGTFCCFLLWQVSRPFLADRGVWPGFLLAVSPLMVYLAASDLIKDVLLTFFCLLALWGGQRVYGERGRRAAGALAVLIGFVGARLIRSYVGALLEVGLAGFPLLLAAWRGRSSLARLAGPLAIVVGVFAFSETVLTAARQRPVIPQVVKMAVDIPNNPQLLSGPLGRVESVSSALPVNPGSPQALAADSSKIPAGLRQRLLHHAFDIVRRTYGPFLWVPLDSNHVENLLIGNWSAYLDSILWYWAWPFGLYGGWRLLKTGRWDGWFVAAVVFSFSALLFVFHVSYRQRGSNLLPLLFLSACFGWVHAGPRLRRAILLCQGSILLFLALAYWTLRLRGRV